MEEPIKKEFQNPLFKAKVLGKAIFTHSKCQEYLGKISQEELEELNNVLKKISSKYFIDDELLQIAKEEFKTKNKITNIFKAAGFLDNPDYDIFLKQILNFFEPKENFSDFLLQMVEQKNKGTRV